MIKKSCALLSVFLLGACAYAMNESNQPLTVLTPGTEGAECDVYSDNVRYIFHPPETRNIIKSQDNLVVDCMAPGNRHKKVVIESGIENNTLLNASNGIAPGLAWDYASKAMFKFPSTVNVDFSDDPPNAMPLPSYENADVISPSSQSIESYGPSEAMIESDRLRGPSRLIRRGENAGNEYQDSGLAAPAEAAPSGEGDKGELMKVIDKMSNEMNPASTAPASTFPGQ